MRYSKQREAIIDQLKKHKDHPTADIIYAELRAKGSNISLATVYRNLKKLSENGVIKRLTGVGEADHFDPTVEKHYHFVCRKCDRVMDIPMEVAENLDLKAREFIGDGLEGHELIFYGVCRECRGEDK